MTKTYRRVIGDEGEKHAVKYLETEGFDIIERNYLKKWGELDIIAKKNNVLYFVEVKTITSNFHLQGNLQGNGWHRPEDNLHKKKVYADKEGYTELFGRAGDFN